MMRTFALLLLLAAALAQPDQLPEQAQGPRFVVGRPAPGRLEDVRAVGNAISEAVRAKFQQPAETDTVVAGEFLVTFALDTSPSTINEAARMIQQADAAVDLKALGNQQYGWKGVSFGVPATYTPEQTAALLDSLLQLEGAESGEASIVFTAIQKKIKSSPAPRPSPSPSPPPPPPAECPTVVDGTISTQTPTPSWGLDRIDTRTRTGDRIYQYSTNGATGVNVFVVDTGVQANHPELAGRVHLTDDGGFDAFNGIGADGHGHGTHCSGTIGGTSVGVAKAVQIYAVKVLDDNGSGSSTTVVAGINHVANSPVQNKIISMSLGGGFSSSINSAVAGAYNAGVLVVAAAGNDNADACTKSPASAPTAITVGASDSSDNKASFSNWGSCVDIWAPGVSIYSSTIPSTYASWSGTSMATPHVAGVAARMWSRGLCSSAASCSSALTCLATENIVAGLTGTYASANRLLHIPPGV